MDPLSRIEAVARPLLQTVDTALTTLGAPPEHPVWGLLREVGATPGDAVRFLSQPLAPHVGEIADRLRELAGNYREAVAPPAVTWRGQAGDEYAAMARAHDAYLRDDLVGGINDTAAYLAEVEQWQQQARLDVARALGEVLGCAEAVTLAQAQADPVSRAAVLAAAEVAAHILRVIAAVIADGEAVRQRWAEAAVERPMRTAAVVGAAPPASVIEVHH